MTIAKLFIAVLLILYEHVRAVPKVDPLVDTKLGLIRGQRAPDGDYSMFLGIPYAKVNESNVFGPSIPHPTIEDIFDAIDDSAFCPQVEEFNGTIAGTLDCLNLNVFVPNSATSKNPFPVLVWFHGGGLAWGRGGTYVYGPKFLVRHDIVLVSVNYRLGPFGFMCLDIPEVPGNQGLKDQKLALEWIKENIAAFGGNVNKITIFGESAGSVSVDLHSQSDSNNLFHQIIMQSGSSFSPTAILNPKKEGAFKVAAHLGFDTDDIYKAVDFLNKVKPGLVIAASKELNFSFRACVESQFEGVESFLTEYPLYLSASKIKQIPILIGFNSDESLFTHAHIDLSGTDFVSNVITRQFNFDNDKLEELSKILKHFYFGDQDYSEDTRRQVIDLHSDFNYAFPTQRRLNRYFEAGVKSVYSYLFSFVGERNFVKYSDNITFGGASHADELSYLFDVSYMKTIMSEEEQVIVDRITTFWTNFAKYGNPTPETTDLVPLKWIPATKDRWNYLNINTELSMETRPFHERIAFLDLFFKMNEKYQIGYDEDYSLL